MDLIATELGLIEPTAGGLVLKETAPGVSIDEVRRATAVDLVIVDDVREMPDA